MKITFKRSGDFYEATHDEARAVARVCGLTLTTRRGDGAPMCGVPVWSSPEPFSELRAAGHVVEVEE